MRTDVTGATTPTVRNRGMMMAVLGCCFLVVMMDNTILNVALQTIQRDLGASNSELQWSVDSYILVYAALMFSAGLLADGFGRRRILLLGMVLFGVASVFSAFATSPAELVAWRAVMGVGGAVAPSATLAVINENSTPGQRAKAIGLWSAIGGLSIALGPIVGGFLLEHFWWGSVFLVNVPVVLVCGALMFRYVPESRGPRRRLDLPGVLLSILGTAALVFGVIRGGELGSWTDVSVLGSIVAGVLLLVLLVVVEKRVSEPALDIGLLRKPAFAAGAAALAGAFFAVTGGTFLLVFYVQGVRGFSPFELGLILLPVAAGTLVSAMQSGTLAGRYGARAVVVGGLVLMALAFGWMGALGQHTGLWQLELALTVAGLGLGCVMGTATSTAMTVVPAERSGAGAAVNNTLRQLGAALGVAVLGSVLSQRYGSALGDAVDELPTALRDGAADSLGGTLSALAQARASGVEADELRHLAGLAQQARQAYLTSMQLTFVVGALVLLVAAGCAFAWLPRRSDPTSAGTGAEVGDGTPRPVRAGSETSPVDDESAAPHVSPGAGPAEH